MLPRHRFRLIFIALISFLSVTGVVFLRRTTSIFLCGLLGLNSASCYSFSNQDGKADAAVPPSSAVVTSNDFSVVQQDEQKIAGCLFGICPPSIPGITGGNPLDMAKTAITKQIGESLGVSSPLLLDQKTAFPDVSDQVKDFHPQSLTITSAEDLKKPLPPGDYSLSVIAYCTQFSIHAPGRGLPYKLARLQGKQAPAISALLARGTLQNIAPATLNADAWRIQAGLPLKQWPPQDQDLIHKLIPEYEKGLEGDYLQRIENTYNKYHAIPGVPSFNDLLKQVGPPGQLVLQLRQARQVLSDKTVSAERLPDMLYEPTNDGLPRVLPASKDSSPSHWAEVQPGVFARFTVIEGNLGRNLFEFRVTPKASAALNSFATSVAQNFDKSLKVSDGTTSTPTLAKLIGADGSNGLIGYSISRPSQALISSIPSTGGVPINVVDQPCSDKEDSKQQCNPKPKVHAVFVGGFFASHGDTEKTIKNYETEFCKEYSEIICTYHSWDDESGVLNDITNAPPGDIIRVVGHSYGGDTSAKVIGEGKRDVDTLILIDPVSQIPVADYPNTSEPKIGRTTKPLPPTWEKRVTARIVKAKTHVTGRFIDVDVMPGKNEDFTDVVAYIGGKWDEVPKMISGILFIPDYGKHHGNYYGLIMNEQRLELNNKTLRDVMAEKPVML